MAKSTLNEIRIPLDQYAYINIAFEGTPEETLTEYRRLIALSKAPVEAKMGLELKDFQRLLYKYQVTGSLQMEDLELIGTAKLYSQHDILNIQKNIFAKITRDNSEPRQPRK